MATRLFTRSLLTTKQTISSVLSRSYTSLSLSTPPSTFSLLRHRHRLLVAVSANFHQLSLAATATRGFATRQTSSSLNDPSPNWSNRPPKETILLDGCDFEHWLVVVEKPEGEPTREEIIDSYIKTLAMVVGSEEEARMKIYSVSTRHYFAFGALVSEELSYKIKELPRVRWVLPDSYLDVRNKDYGGEPFINGQVVPYDPKYHEEWLRNHDRSNDRKRRNDRPRNADRSRNFTRRGENMQNRDFQPPPVANQNMQNPGTNIGGVQPRNTGGVPPSNSPNMRGMQPNNMGGGPPNWGGMQPNNVGGGGPPYIGGMPSNNMGGGPPNMGEMPSNNIGGGGPPYMGGMPSNNMGGGPPNMGGMPPNNMGGGGPPNMGGMPPNNMGGGGSPNMGGMPSNNMGVVTNNAPNYQYRDGANNGGMPYQSNQMPGPGPNNGYQNGYTPGMDRGNPYQTQSFPGRDAPQPPLNRLS